MAKSGPGFSLDGGAGTLLPHDVYRLMGYPERQMEMMRQSGLMQGNWMAYLAVGSAVFLLGYLLFVTRYFRPQARTDAGT